MPTSDTIELWRHLVKAVNHLFEAGESFQKGYRSNENRKRKSSQHEKPSDKTHRSEYRSYKPHLKRSYLLAPYKMHQVRRYDRKEAMDIALGALKDNTACIIDRKEAFSRKPTSLDSGYVLVEAEGDYTDGRNWRLVWEDLIKEGRGRRKFEFRELRFYRGVY